jgi:DNA-3-methyladenine glycosylase I
MNQNTNHKPISQMVTAIESYLRENCFPGAYERWLERYNVPVSERNDRFLFEKLVQATFSGGMRGVVVDQKMPTMGVLFDSWDPSKISQYTPSILEQKSDSPNVIRNKPKLAAIVYNARVICQLREKYGSFGKFLTSFDFETLVGELIRRFEYLGPVTVHDFLRNE